MAKLIQVAESFRNFFYALMGKKLKGSQKGIVNESLASGVADIGTAGDAAAGGLDNATGAAEDLRKALSVLPFDQLNQLTDNSTSGGSGGGGGGGVGGGGVGSGIDFGDLADAVTDLEEGEVPVNEWAERMRKAFLEQDWDKLGEEIAWGINKGLEKIYDVLDWKKVGPKIEKFIDAFTTTLNSLVDSIEWDLIGRDFGRGLNIITKTANSFLEKFDFRNLGRKLSTGLRGALDEIDWKELGNMLGNGFMVAWDILGGFVEDMSRKDGAGITGWAQLGKSIGNSLNGVFEKIDFSRMARTLSDGINGVFETLLNFTITFDWKAFADNVVNGINTFIENTDWQKNGKALETFLDNFFSTLLDMASRIEWEEFARGIGQFLSEIDWGQHLMQMFNVLTEVIGGIWNGLGETAAGKFIQAIIVFKIGTKLMPFVDSIVKFFTGSTVTQKLSGAFQSLFSKSVTTGANTAKKGLSSNAGLIGLATATAAVVLEATKVTTSTQADLPEEIESYDKLSEAFKKLGENAIISKDQVNVLQYQLDNGMASGKDAFSIYWDLGQTLYDLGASAEEVDEVFKLFGDDFENTSYDITNAMTLIGRRDDLGVTTNSLSDLKDALIQLREEGIIKTDTQLDAIIFAMERFRDSGGTVSAATNTIRQALINTGADAEEVDAIMAAFLELPSQNIQMAASTISATLGTLGFTMSEGFANSLAEQTPVMQEKVLTTFQAINEGAKVGADQIAVIFSTMGIELPNSIAGTFASMEPSVLSSTISLFDQISSGQSLKYEELMTAFTNLGLDITNTGLIQTLAAQEPNVQQSALLLLAQLGNGVSLSSNQLVYAFQSLGIGIANDGIIDTLANAEPQVQQQAIDLLGQIQSAAASERQPLIDEFNSLGVGTINEGLLSALDSMDYDTRQKVISLLSEISGATTERKGEIVDELEDLGLDVTGGLIDGMGEKERELSEKALGLSDATLKAFRGSEGFDTGSPSKKTTDIGEDVGQGLINGMLSKQQNAGYMAESIANTVLNKFRNISSETYRIGQNAISNFIRGWQSMYIPTPHMYVSSYDRYVTGKTSINVPNFSVDWYAVGGLFRQPTIAGIGEKGAEAVLPLTNRRTMGMIADSILSNASVGMDEEVLTNAVARGVAMAMMNNQGNQTPITVYAELKTENDEVLARAVTRGQQKLDYRMKPSGQI